MTACLRLSTISSLQPPIAAISSIRRVQPAVGIEVANHADRRVADVPLDRTHVQLPLEMIGERWRPGQKLFESRRVFFVLDFLSFVSRVEVILKLPAKINFLKRIARAFLADDLVANRVFTQIRGRNFMCLRLSPPSPSPSA